MMRFVRCRESLARASVGERLGATTTSSSKLGYHIGNIRTFFASIKDFQSRPTSCYGVGRIKQALCMLSSIIDSPDFTYSKSFPRIFPVIIYHREVNVEAQPRSSEGTNTELQTWWFSEAESKDSGATDAIEPESSWVIDAVCGIFREKPWGPETKCKLENCNFSYDANIVRKVLKSVPLEIALQFFYWLKSRGFHHDFSTYHTMIDALGEGKCLDKMKELVEELREAGHTIRLMLYRDVLYWCACAGDTAGVCFYWDEMKEAQIKPSASMYTTIISVYAKNKQYNAAINMYTEMVEAGLVLNPRTFSIFIDHLVDLGRLDAATMTFTKMKELKTFPIMSTHAKLMVAHAKLGNLERVKMLGKDLRYVCDRPGTKFWEAVDSLLGDGMEKEAKLFAGEVWPELSEKEREEHICKLRKLKADEEMLGNDLTDFEFAIDKDDSQPVDKSKQSISFLQMEKVLKNWDSSTLVILKEANIQWRNDDVYELLLKRIQKPDIAWKFFSWVKCHPRIRLDVFNQITMLRILSRSKKFSILISLLGEMQREGLKLSISIFNVMIKDCGYAKNAKVAFYIFDCIKGFRLEPDQESYFALLHAYTRHKCCDEAFALFIMMEQADCIPDSSTCIALIHALGFTGKVDKAEIVFKRLLDSGIEQTAEAYTAIIKSCNHVGKVELAFEHFDTMKQAGIVPLTDTLRSMAWVCLQSGNSEKFQEFMKQTKETHSAHQRILMRRKNCLMSIGEVLVKNLLQQREISCSESDR